jgi:hypothetical protein
MTRSDRGGLVFLVSLLSLSVPTLAQASEGDVAAARALFTEARKLVAAGDYAAACSRFADSYKLDPGIGTSFNLADCEEHLGRTASAWLRFLDVAAATKAAGQLDRERVARARAAALEPRLPKLVINVPSPAPKLVVRRDGDVVPQNVWGVALPIDPGEHTLEATAPGRRKRTRNVTIAATPELTSIQVPALELAPETRVVVGSEAPAAPGLGSPASPPARDEGRKIPRISSWLGGVGVASLATGTVFAVLMELNNAQAEKLCTMTDPLTQRHNLCLNIDEETQHDQYLHAAERDRAIYYAAAGVGAASVIVAGAWWWRSWHAPNESKRYVSFTMAPVFSANAAQVGVQAAW